MRRPAKSSNGRRGWAARLFTGLLLAFIPAPLVGAADADTSLLEPVLSWKDASGSAQLALRRQFETGKPPGNATNVFRAVSPGAWQPGLVPLFGIDRSNRFELRRRPLRGQENFTDPLFLALPLADEPDAARIAGRWQCTATRTDGSKPWFGWELAFEGGTVAGRFDNTTDYRFAYMTTGSFRSNRLELRVEYINDTFELHGEWRDGRLTGSWRRTDDLDHGQWEAHRPSATEGQANAGPAAEAARLLPNEALPLHEWRRESDGARHYSTITDAPGPGWIRSPRALCRVWSVTGSAPEPETR